MTRVDAARAPLFSRALENALLAPGDYCDRYQLVQQVAQGGMANVWLGRLRAAHGFERLVALKTILPVFAKEPRFRSMFLDEARIASRINHANVATIFDMGERDGNLYLVMEWIDGDSLSSLARAAEDSPRKFPLPLVLKILADACAGLHAAHELKDDRGRLLDVVHRDVSPQNILVSATGTVKVIDFGVAKSRVRIGEETSIGAVKGKLHYMAPERALGLAVDRRADVWSLGAVLYRLLAGRPAYRGPDEPSIINQLVSGTLPDALPPRFPVSVQRVVSKALAPNPQDRYATAADLQQALEDVLVELAAPVTTQAIAEFMAARLGQSLALRRFAVSTAVERLDQSVTLRVACPVAPASADVIVVQPPHESAERVEQVSVQAVPTPSGAFPALKIEKSRVTQLLMASLSPLESSAPPEPRAALESSDEHLPFRSSLAERARQALQALGAVSLGVIGLAGVQWVMLPRAQPAPAAPAPHSAALASHESLPDGRRQPGMSLAPCPSLPYVQVDDLSLERAPREHAPTNKSKRRFARPRPLPVTSPAAYRAPAAAVPSAVVPQVRPPDLAAPVPVALNNGPRRDESSKHTVSDFGF